MEIRRSRGLSKRHRPRPRVSKEEFELLLLCDGKHDITKCIFFENGWYEKANNALKEWRLEKIFDI